MENSQADNTKIDNIYRVYKQQHYFVDRHEIMAEQMLTVILVLTTIIAAIITFNFNDIRNIYLAVPFIIYIICFLISIFEIMCAIQPLSSKSSKFLETFNSNWPNESIIYYRGIIEIMKKALAENNSPLDEYRRLLGNEVFEKDLIKQICILANYSDIKRRHLEKAKKISNITIFVGAACIILYIFFTFKGN